MRVAAVACALLVLAPMGAWAHEERSLHALTVLESVEPAIDGIEIRVVHLGAPALVATNRSSKTLTIVGVDGEPFLRIGRRGVFTNTLSPTAYRSVDPAGGSVPSVADPRAAPQWARLSNASTWTWFDPRITYESERSDWSVPMLVAGAKVTASGGYEPLNGHGHFVTRLSVPEVEGLELRMVQGPVPGLFVRNETRQVLHVPGAAGEPMLRIGPDGVWANLRSPSYHTSAAQMIRRIPPSADPAATPRWKKLSSTPVWGWLDHAGAVPAELMQRSILGPQTEPVLEWDPSLRLGTRDLQARGRVVWIPPHADTGTKRSGAAAAVPWRLMLLGVLVAAGISFVSLTTRVREGTA